MARPNEPMIDTSMPRNPMVNIAGDFTAPDSDEQPPSERITATGQSTLGNDSTKATDAGKKLVNPGVDFPVDE